MTKSRDQEKTATSLPGLKPAAAVTPEIAAFLADLKRVQPALATGRRGRLIFAMDATMSRQPTWDLALSLQAEMFKAVDRTGGLSVQLAYFRGMGEARTSRWTDEAGELARLMTTVSCRGGATQIGRMLEHARDEHARMPVNAFVFVGDAMEEPIDRLCATAGEMGLRHLPAFMFQEGTSRSVETAFREIARLSGGAHAAFGQGSADELRALLAAVAVYASGGLAALTGRPGVGAQKLIEQLKP